LDEVNLVKNARFALGKKKPQSWRWHSEGDAARWAHAPSTNGRTDRVMLIESDDAEQSAVWAQTVPCKREQHYRFEADVECNCTGTGEACGVVLSVRCHGQDGPLGSPRRFAPVRQTCEVLTLRGYFKTPAQARRIEIRIGIAKASGWARIHDVRLMDNLELDACSHVLAVPPPAHSVQPPRVVRRVVVCGEADACPSLLEILRLRFGAANVRTQPIGKAGVQRLRADAILIPGDTPPADLCTVAQLEQLCRNRIVVISIEAFARLFKTPPTTKTIEQRDDPLHAKVTCGCFITTGFAMQDVFPFAGVGDRPPCLVQRQFVTNRAFHDFRKRHGFEIFLTAVTDNDRTMDKPIGLYRPTPNGAAVVCDLDALEARPTTLGEPTVAAALLLNMLGGTEPALGQYVAPARSESEFRGELVDLGTRYQALACLGLDRSESSVEGAVVRLGHDDESFGLALPRRPAMVIRTGLRGGDEDGIYGTQLWLKRLVRPAPFLCAHARYLTRRFRVFWLPLHRAWNDAVGLLRPSESRRDTHDEFDPGATRVVIDVTACAENALRVVVGRTGALFEHCARALPALARAMDPHRFVIHAPEPGAAVDDFDRRAWCLADIRPEVLVDETSFCDPLHRSTLDSGGDVVRIELPRSLTDLTADSIWRTDLAACTLDRVVGQTCDAFATNHVGSVLELDVTDVLGESCECYHVLTLDPRTGEERAECYQMNTAPVVRLAPGAAICK